MIIAHKRAKSGFTLIELMIAITILAILSVVVVPNFMKYLESARKSSAQTTLRSLKQAVTMYYAQVGQYPQTLKDLVRRPSNEKAAKKWQSGGYLEKKEIPEDPWGNRYKYSVAKPGSDQAYELYSYGPNGKGSPKTEWISVWDE